MGGWTDEEETGGVVAGRKRGWGCGQMTAPTHLKAGGIDFILLEARGPIGKDAGDFGIEGPTGVPTVSKPPFRPQILPPTGYLFGPELQRLLPGFPEVFRLANVGLGNRSREPRSVRGQEEEGEKNVSTPKASPGRGCPNGGASDLSPGHREGKGHKPGSAEARTLPGASAWSRWEAIAVGGRTG